RRGHWPGLASGRSLRSPWMEGIAGYCTGQQRPSHHRRAPATLRSAASPMLLGSPQRPKFKAGIVPTAYITHPSSLLHDMGPYHPECPDRLRAIDDRLISSGLDGYLQHHEAPAATHEQLTRVHSESYLAGLEAGSPASGLHYIDPDTAMCPD